MDLLEKASVILTATAYNNGEALCVKPSDGSGDFDFSRNSAATRVNAQGLVENVQILSSNLVQNGDFTNGSTDWIVGSDWSIAGNKAVSSGSGNNLQQAVNISSNKTYKLTFDVISTSGVLACDLGGAAAKTLTDSGSKEYYFQSVNTNNLRFYGSAYYGEITNISVIEITDDTNLPRINYENGCGSWLFEPQSTNLITQSELFSDSSWLKEGSATLGLNTYLSPSGENNASELNLPSNLSRITYVLNTTGVHTFSIYLKSDTDGTISLRSATGNPAVTKQVNLTDRWQRFDISVTDGNYWQVIKTASDTLTSVYIWGAQLEALSYASSLIPTSGSQVTRNQDVCNNGGSLATINSTEGVLYAEIAALANDGTIREISINNGSIFNRVSIYYTASVIYAKWQGANGGIDLFHIIPEVTDFHKVAIKYKSGDTALWVDGLEVDTSSSVNSTSGLNVLDFDRAVGANKFYGKTKALAVWKEALSDSELQSLTTI